MAWVSVALLAAVAALWFANLRAGAELRERLEAIDQGALPAMLRAHRLALDLDQLRFHATWLLEGPPAAHDHSARALAGDLARLRVDTARFATPSDDGIEARLWKSLEGQLAQVERQVPRLLAPRPDSSPAILADPGFRADVLELEKGCDLLVAVGEHEAEVQSRLLRQEAGHSRRLQLGTASGFALLLLAFLGWAAAHERRHLREVAAYSTALEQVNVELEAFAGRVAHDLRAPLMPIQGNAALIANGLDPERSRELATRIVRTTGRLSDLVDGLLSFASGRRFGTGRCDAAEVLAGLLVDIEERARTCGTELRISTRPAPVECPHPLVASVLQNLIDNALKYGGRKDRPGCVTVVVESLGHQALISVSDDGEGMAEEVRRRAFEPFFRGAKGGRGAGLGLATVQRIVEAHGGALSLESSPGAGTRCRVILPSAAEPTARA